MEIMEYPKVEPARYNSAEINGIAARIVIGKEQGSVNFCMRVFEFAPDGFTRRHSHDWEHEMFIHQGRGEILNNGQWHPICAGNAVFIPENEELQIRNSSDD